MDRRADVQADSSIIIQDISPFGAAALITSKLQSNVHRIQTTEHRRKHRVKSREHRVQSTEHIVYRIQRTEKSTE